jgi:hypothetical protein
MAEKTQPAIEQQIKNRKWRWIGHELHKSQDATERHALGWNTQGISRTTWQRTTEREMQKVGISWKEAKELELDTTKRKTFTKALRSR